MKQKLVLKLCSLGLLMALAAPAGVVQGAEKVVELKIGQVSRSAGPGIQVPITLRSTNLARQEIQGLVAVFEWEATAPLTGTNIINAPALTNPTLLTPDPTPGPDATPGADTIVKRIGEQAGKRFMVLGVVMDSNGDDREIIPVTNTADVLVATAEFTGGEVTANTPVDLRVAAADSKYSADLGGAGPVQDNLVVIGSQSLAIWLNTVGDNQGALTGVDGRVTITPGGLAFRVAEVSGNYPQAGNRTFTVPVTMENNRPVQGYVVALAHRASDPITLSAVRVGTAGQGSDFIDGDERFTTTIGGVNHAGGIMAVVRVLDENPPFPAPIPVGLANQIALFDYSAAARPCCNQGQCVTDNFTLRLVDGVGEPGAPLKDNMVVIDMASIGAAEGLDISDTGRLSLTPETCVIEPEGVISFTAGSCDTLVQGPAGVLGPAPMVVDGPGNTSMLGVYYRSPESDTDDGQDEADQNDHIQGFSIGITYDANCLSCTGNWSIAGTITEAVGAEFVNVHCKDDNPGRPGELVIGILVDALPPFEGQDLPPTFDYLKLICVEFQANEGASCATCKSTPVNFVNGVIGAGNVPTSNLASIRVIENGSVMVKSVPVAGVAGSAAIDFRTQATFLRGNCNSQAGVDIADAASIISFLFYTTTWKFEPVCHKACDANDDGRVDLADTVSILRYLFKFDQAPRAPFPAPGTDPTDDRLTCDNGTAQECPQ